MFLAIAIAVLLVTLGILWVAVAREPGPPPEEVALGYEHAWDRLDFDVLYDLSGSELRDGMTRADFVAAHRTIHDPDRGGIATRIGIEHSVTHDRHAEVTTVVESARETLHNAIHLERRRSRWEVVGYRLGDDPSRA